MAETPFETRLRAQIRDVLNSHAGPHPVWSDSPAAMRTSDRRRRGGWPIRLLGVAALLAIGGGVLSQVGSGQPRTHDPSPSPESTPPAVVGAPEIPDILWGQFVVQVADPNARGAANAYPWYFVDLADNVLIHGPGNSEDPAELQTEAGTAAAWAGRVVEFTPASAGSAAVVIQAPPPCGEARYVVRYDVAPRRDQPWTLTFTQPEDRCTDRLEILVGSSSTLDLPSAAPLSVTPSSSVTSSRVWAHQPSRLVVGQGYGSWSFTEPFHFVMPAEGPTSVFTWLAPGRLHFSHPYWAGDLLDDWELPTDHCHPGTGSIRDIPSSPQAFESWLRSNGRAIDRSAAIDVDGRTAMRYDTSESASAAPTDCPGLAPGERDWNTIDFLSRWYLIPTGDDTILFNVYGDTDTEYQAADALVRSMTFDQR